MSEQYEDEFSEAPALSIDQYNEWCEKFADAYNQKKELEAQIEALTEITEGLKPKILEGAEALKLLQEDTNSGLIKGSHKSQLGTFSFTEKHYVNQVTGDAKIKLFNYLKSKGVFEEMVQMHYGTLNSFVADEIEANGGVKSGYLPPGIEKLNKMREVRFRSNKKKIDTVS